MNKFLFLIWSVKYLGLSCRRRTKNFLGKLPQVNRQIFKLAGSPRARADFHAKAVMCNIDMSNKMLEILTHFTETVF